MTTIVVHGNKIAADTQSTYGDGRKVPCCKLYRKKVTVRDEVWEVIIGTAGGDYAGELFVHWYDGTDKPRPEVFGDITPDEDFECILLHPDGVFTVNRFCLPVRQLGDFVAVGSGAKAAIAAMKAGADVKRAVEIARELDCWTGGVIQVMEGPTRLSKVSRK